MFSKKTIRQTMIFLVILTVFFSDVSLWASRVPRPLNRVNRSLTTSWTKKSPLKFPMRVLTRQQILMSRNSYDVLQRNGGLPSWKNRPLPFGLWLRGIAKRVPKDHRELEVTIPVLTVTTTNGHRIVVNEVIFDEGYRILTFVDASTGVRVAESSTISLTRPLLHQKFNKPTGEVTLDISKNGVGFQDVLLFKKASGNGWTQAVLEALIRYWEAYYGVPPENLPGTLVAKNAEIFMSEFAKLSQEFSGRSTPERQVEALRRTPAGKARLALGYSELQVTSIQHDGQDAMISFTARRPRSVPAPPSSETPQF